MIKDDLVPAVVIEVGQLSFAASARSLLRPGSGATCPNRVPNRRDLSELRAPRRRPEVEESGVTWIQLIPKP